MKFDLVLLYYNNPNILYNWFYRLLNFTDFLRFNKQSQIIIADSGTPEEFQKETIEVINNFSTIYNNIIYAVADTKKIREKVSNDIDPRPACHAYNMATIDISTADLILTSNIGHLFSPKYFEKVLIEHIKNEKAVVLPGRWDLLCSNYHSNPYINQKSFEYILNNWTRRNSGGWPDMSIRRKWILEVGGWDENYITIAPVDMDMGSRLTGKLDNGQPSEMLYPNKPPFKNLGLDFIQPNNNDVYSLTCNTYSGHVDKEDPRRQKGLDIGHKYYLENWGIIKRNVNRKPLDYKIYKFKN
jgi:hypothetical protein